jgi:hypothetical protein
VQSWKADILQPKEEAVGRKRFLRLHHGFHEGSLIKVFDESISDNQRFCNYETSLLLIVAVELV